MNKSLASLFVVASVSFQCDAVDMVGKTISRNTYGVTSQVSGVIGGLTKDVGDKTSKFEVVATIEDSDFLIEVDKKSANLNISSANLKFKDIAHSRMESLLSKNSLSKNDVDASEAGFMEAVANVQHAEAELKKAELDLYRTVIKPPIDGYVVSREVRNGDWVNQGDLVYTISNIDTITVRLLASEHDLMSLSVGQTLVVWPEAAPSKKITTTIKRIGVKTEPATHAYPVEAEITNEDHSLKPDMSVMATTKLAGE